MWKDQLVYQKQELVPIQELVHNDISVYPFQTLPFFPNHNRSPFLLLHGPISHPILHVLYGTHQCKHHCL